MQIASGNTSRLARLVDDLLDVRKLAAGGFSLSLAEVNLSDVVRRAISLQAPVARLRAVDLDLVAPEEIVLSADASRIEQVVTNLVSNAVKHSPPDESVSVSVHRRGDVARVAVVDRGPGVPDAFRSRIFLRFSQADASSTRAGQGAGLGLYIAKTIVELHGGKLGFESPKEGGAMFFFELLVQRRLTERRGVAPSTPQGLPPLTRQGAVPLDPSVCVALRATQSTGLGSLTPVGLRGDAPMGFGAKPQSLRG